MNILLVEDEYDVARNICDSFEADGHRIEWAPDGLIGLDCATRQSHDLIILDIALPRLSGIELCRRLRALGLGTVPIMMLTARSDLEYKITAFDSGADDYLLKPFALEELGARARALVRRAHHTCAQQVLRVADLSLDTATHCAQRGGRALALTNAGRKILETLMRNTHRVVSRQELEYALWGDDPPASNALKIHVHGVREVVDKPFAVALIKTLRGVGYRLCEET